MKKVFFLFLSLVFVNCVNNSEPDATEIYIETWDNFEYMEDWQQEAISCIVVLQKRYEDYPDPNRMDEFQDYFFETQ